MPIDDERHGYQLQSEHGHLAANRNTLTGWRPRRGNGPLAEGLSQPHGIDRIARLRELVVK
jgi:hypothetical protein